MVGFDGSIVAIIAILSVFVVPFVTVAWIITSLIKSRQKERSELISHGIQPSYKKFSPNKYTSLRNGCLFIGLALGLIIGIIINLQASFTEISFFLVLSASTLLFLGIGYIVFYSLVKDKNIEEE